MGQRVLIIPDKFKGSLTASQAAAAIAAGWQRSRPDDMLDLLPMTDGGEGFGEIFSSLLGARARHLTTVNAAHQSVRASWWWEAKTKTAIIESAQVIGLSLLPAKKYHPFQLDTFGLGKILQKARRAGASKILMGIGGSATNDGGFGLARALGWRFLDQNGRELKEWWRLVDLVKIERAPNIPDGGLVVAVDVKNPLLGASGCARVFGPQKGIRPEDFELAEKCLRQMALVLRKQYGVPAAETPGGGAAGGLGFGLMAFARGHIESGFELFARHAEVQKRIRGADLVITGEGTIDAQTHMGKGVGQVARWSARCGVPCLGLAGAVEESVRASGAFALVGELLEMAPLPRAKRQAARLLEELAGKTARAWAAGVI